MGHIVWSRKHPHEASTLLGYNIRDVLKLLQPIEQQRNLGGQSITYSFISRRNLLPYGGLVWIRNY